MIGRRDFIAGIAGAASWPLVARAQQLPTVGFLNANRSSESAFQASAFRKGLSEFGYIEGQNVFVEYRWAEGKYEALPALARELVDHHVTVLFATPSPAAVAAKAATSTIPVVFTTAFDAVRQGLVVSYNRPGGNLTGLNQLSGILGPKRLDLLRRIVPDKASTALLVNPSNPNAQPEVMEIQEAARATGQHIFMVNASIEGQLESAFASIVEKRGAAVLLIADAFLFSLRETVVALTLQHRIPAIFENREYAEAGGLLAYGARSADNMFTAGQYVGRILKGAKPADLPVLQPTKFELVINLKTARAIGLDVPPTLLALADEVIE